MLALMGESGMMGALADAGTRGALDACHLPARSLGRGAARLALAGLALIVAASATMGQTRQPEQGRASLLPIQGAPLPAAPALRLVVPGVLLGAPASELAFAIEIAPAGAMPANSFVRIRGLPPTAALTEGHAIAPGAWAVPASALATLRIALPTGLAGKSDITVTLVTIDGVVIAEAKSALIIAAAGLIAPAAPATPAVEAKPKPAEPPPPAVQPPAAAPPVAMPALTPPIAPASPPSAPPSPSQMPNAALPPATPTAPPPPAPESRQRAQAFMARGNGQLSDGNIVAARLFFERAADEGLAEGALAMGATFDPAELARQRVQGTLPDLAAARRWYERARALGSTSAVERLDRLGRR